MAASTERHGGSVCAFAGLVSTYALIQLVCVSSAVMGIPLTSRRATSALVVCLAGSVVVAWRCRGQPVGQRGPASRRDDGPLAWLAWVVAGGALCWATTLWARLWVLAYRRPSYDWDGLYYHVPALSEWVRQGHLGFIQGMPDIPFVNYPMGIEATTFLLHEALGFSELVDACNLWYWPLAFSSVAVLAERLGAHGAWRWLAGTLLAGAPVMVCQGVTSYTDPGAASCAMAAFAATVLFVFDDGRPPVWTAVLWGASVGLVLGSKGTGLPMSAAFGVAGVAGVVLRVGRRHLGEWLPRMAVAACVAIAVGGYWYARNAYYTGNPVHPIQVKFGARVLIEGYDAAAFTANNQPEWLTRFPAAIRGPVSWLQLDAPIQGYAPVGGLGYIWPVAEVPAILFLAWLALRRRPGIRRDEVVLAIGLALILLVVQPATWWARFTLWLHALGLAALGAVLCRWWGRSSATGRLLAAACALSIVVLAAWESERTLGIEQARGRVAMPPGQVGETYLSSAHLLFPGLTETAGFDDVLEADATGRSRWGRAGTLLGGILALPLGRREMLLLPPAPTQDDLARLDASGIRSVVWDVSGAGAVPEVLRQRAVEQSEYAPSQDVRLHILRLGPAAP